MAQLLCRDKAGGLSEAAQANGGFGKDAEHPGRNDCLSWHGHTAGPRQGQLPGGHSLPRQVTVTFPSQEAAPGRLGQEVPGAAPCSAPVMPLCDAIGDAEVSHTAAISWCSTPS